MATSTNRAGRGCFTWNTLQRPCSRWCRAGRRERLLVERGALSTMVSLTSDESCVIREGRQCPPPFARAGPVGRTPMPALLGGATRSNGAVLLLAEHCGGVRCARRDVASVRRSRPPASGLELAPSRLWHRASAWPLSRRYAFTRRLTRNSTPGCGESRGTNSEECTRLLKDEIRGRAAMRPTPGGPSACLSSAVRTAAKR